MPYLRPWIEENLGVDLSYRTPSVDIKDIQVSNPITCDELFLEFLRSNNISYSNSKMHRVNRSHGQTLHDILPLRNEGKTGKIPDLVIWAQSEVDVKKVCFLAFKKDRM